jgi:hypothetical protein
VNIILPISKIHAAAPGRKPGYLQECLRIGKVSGSGQAQLVEFTPAQYADLRRRFAMAQQVRQHSGLLAGPKPGEGWGDAVHRIAGPIGRAIGWPCMKGDGTTDLKPGSPCDQARGFLNNLSTPKSEPITNLSSRSPAKADSIETRTWRPPAYPTGKKATP